MRFEPAAIDPEVWDTMMGQSAQRSLIQCWEYGTAKAEASNWQVERGILVNDKRPVGLAQAFVRRLPFGFPGGFAWINRAPVLSDPAPDSATIGAALRALSDHFVRERGLYARLAPPFPQERWPEAAESPGMFGPTTVLGWASARLDLSLAEDQLRANLRGNWRNHLKKAEKLDLTLEFGSDDGLFDQFLASQQAFLREQGFSTTISPAFLRRLQSLLPANRKMMVFLAKDENGFLGSLLIARYGSTCEYLAGNGVARRPGIGTGQLLLWRAVLEMKRLGCTTLDLGGMDSERTPKGIYDFKAGLNPTPYRHANEMEAGGRSLTGRLVRLAVARARQDG